MIMEEYEKTWVDYWKPYLTKDGVMDTELIKIELHILYKLMQERVKNLSDNEDVDKMCDFKNNINLHFNRN